VALKLNSPQGLFGLRQREMHSWYLTEDALRIHFNDGGTNRLLFSSISGSMRETRFRSAGGAETVPLDLSRVLQSASLVYVSAVVFCDVVDRRAVSDVGGSGDL